MLNLSCDRTARVSKRLNSGAIAPRFGEAPESLTDFSDKLDSCTYSSPERVLSGARDANSRKHLRKIRYVHIAVPVKVTVAQACVGQRTKVCKQDGQVAQVRRSARIQVARAAIEIEDV